MEDDELFALVLIQLCSEETSPGTPFNMLSPSTGLDGRYTPRLIAAWT